MEDTLGKKQPSDVFEGDVPLRALRTLLGFIDSGGWERCRRAPRRDAAGLSPSRRRRRRPRRSAHQLQFHSAFERCVARVLYRNEWATQRPAIMKHNGWDKCSSEVMIS